MHRLIYKVLIITTLFFAFLLSPGFAQVVYRLDLHGEVDPRMRRYVELGMREAREEKADALLIHMNTYGGAVVDADSIRTLVLNFGKPVITLIDNNAGSAGALISIASDKIYMVNGATIGAATVVNGTDGSKAPDKYQSYMRGKMRSTAEAKGRDPEIAQAMVDEDIEIPGIIKAGEVITFSSSEALKHGFADKIVSGVSEVLEVENLAGHTLVTFELSTAEKIIRFFLNPAISSILILIMLGGLYFELQSPGVGFPIIASLVAAGLYFTPYYVNGLAEYWEILLFVVGLVLIAAEVFVIPGFGIAGILGISITMGSLVLVMVNNTGFNFDFVPMLAVLHALLVSLSGFIGFIVILVAFGHKLAESPLFSKMVLQSENIGPVRGQSFTPTTYSLIGETGTAHTILRPSGKVLLGEQVYNAVSTGDFISVGEQIVVVDQSGSNLRVKRAEVLV